MNNPAEYLFRMLVWLMVCMFGAYAIFLVILFVSIVGGILRSVLT